ncbi:endo-1,3(4)-beta-glucanase [Coprinopsis cinerea okayama7|uniref:Endo-1,3(4)-beta-glucanase n=1 Tax=Coprinopsis cinerea (strain Okayama-7 / 130 / ATCC MYA-4618 / FGSC 9003) TaxID=240176 RepID=A8N8Y9_COPC7|nr:endo-1,3(4)-beta-glucanase [Coprinopsis cinerea okayama7\|eukprot:XP_001831317.2 endo-1,3(4)-beta-glucanase [Coprinopsis cinerea okayama7\
MVFVSLLSIILLAVSPLEGIAGSQSNLPLRLARRHAKLEQSLHARDDIGDPRYKLEVFYRGESFLNDWDYFSDPDPTHGNVNYQTRENAVAKNLSYVQEDGTMVLAVDDFTDVPVGGKRDSIRISTKKRYNGGLFIADFWKMPHGCSVWPAYWSVGPDWPNGVTFTGEIDILEGVHEQPTNQYTLHSGPGCTLSLDGVEVASRLMHDQCASSNGDNRGCGFLDTDERSYGEPFNSVAGGVFAHLWNNEGIRMWHFPRGEIPADIEAQQPQPDLWGKPVAFWSSKTCDMSEHFYDHTLVLDTTICGDWAGPTYGNSGCTGTCAEAVANTEIFKCEYHSDSASARSNEKLT